MFNFQENSGQTIQQKRSLVADPDADFNEINNQLSPGDFASEMFKSFKSQPIEYDDSEADKKRFTREAIKNYSSYGDIPVYKRTFTITNLLPFMNFAFQFFACSNSNCSSYEYIVERFLLLVS